MSLLEMTRQEKREHEKSGAYPQEPEAVTLRDGTMVTVRPIRPNDALRLQALFARLSPRSIFLRFLAVCRGKHFMSK